MFGNGSSPRRDYSKDPRSAGSPRSSNDSPRKESPSQCPSLADSPHLTPSQRFAGTSTFALPSPPLPSLPSNRSISSIDQKLQNQQRLSHPTVPRSSSSNNFSSPVSPALAKLPVDNDVLGLPNKVIVLNSDRRRGASSLSSVGRSPSFSVGDVVVQAKDSGGKYRNSHNVLKSIRRPSHAPATRDDLSNDYTTTDDQLPQDLADFTLDSRNVTSRYPTINAQPSTPPPAIPRRRIHQDELDFITSPSNPQQSRQRATSFSSPQRPFPDSPAFYSTGKEMSYDHLAEIAAGNSGNGTGFSGAQVGGEDWKSVLVGYQHQRSNASSAPPLMSSQVVGDKARERRSEDGGFGRLSQESDRSSRNIPSGELIVLDLCFSLTHVP